MGRLGTVQGALHGLFHLSHTIATGLPLCDASSRDQEHTGRSTKPLNHSGGNRVEREDDHIALMEGRKGGAEVQSEGSTEFSQVGRQRQSSACREFTREKNPEARQTTAYQETQ